MRETAYAKLNLALHVRSREPDGYHDLETIFGFAEDGDLLSVSEAEELMLTVSGPFADDLTVSDDNLVLRAARALRSATGTLAGAALHLEKRLPVAAGIGGGSADAAAALRLLSRWWKLPSADDLMLEVARQLGADVPACVRSTLVRGEGRGDRLIPAFGPSVEALPILLVNPRVHMSTPAVFAAWDGVDRGPLGQGEILSASLDGRNDLEAAACAIAPVVRELLASLADLEGVLLARMSGSGATCFAMFRSDEARDEGSRRIAAAHPAWWQLVSRLRA